MMDARAILFQNKALAGQNRMPDPPVVNVVKSKTAKRRTRRAATRRALEMDGKTLVIARRGITYCMARKERCLRQLLREVATMQPESEMDSEGVDKQVPDEYLRRVGDGRL